jgi:hypothetical protein
MRDGWESNKDRPATQAADGHVLQKLWLPNSRSDAAGYAVDYRSHDEHRPPDINYRDLRALPNGWSIPLRRRCGFGVFCFYPPRIVHLINHDLPPPSFDVRCLSVPLGERQASAFGSQRLPDMPSVTDPAMSIVRRISITVMLGRCHALRDGASNSGLAFGFRVSGIPFGFS